MYVYHYTTQGYLDRILRDGLLSSNRLTDAAHNSPVIWLAENASLNAPSSADRKFADHIHPVTASQPPGYSWNIPNFACNGDIRVKVRIRRGQLMPWLMWATDDSDIKHEDTAALSEFNDGWNVATMDVKPNQIISVAKWSVHTGAWVKMELSRRLVLPVVAKLVSRRHGASTTPSSEKLSMTRLAS